METLGARWQALSGRSSGSFFTTWAWISSWLSLVDEEQQLFSVQRQTGEDQILAILSQDPIDGSLWVNSPAGKGPRIIFCEYCDILCAREIGATALPLLATQLATTALHINGTVDDFGVLEHVSGRRATRRQKRVAPFVSLEDVRKAERGIDDLISRNTRQQVARAARLENAESGLRIKVATTRDDAHAALEDLVELQRISFQARALQSSLETPFLRTFLDALIDTEAEDGRAELLTFYSDNARVGVLINLIYQGTVANYQGGFALSDHPRAKPGYLVHRAAIEHYARQGFERYSFLAGDAQYKRSLSTDTETLHWALLERPSVVNWAENTARRLTGRLVR